MNLHVIPAGPIQTNAYLLTDQARGEALLIDAPGEIWQHVEGILARERCRLVELWITHGHWDHTQGGAEIVRKTSAKVSAALADHVLIETPDVMKRFTGIQLKLEPIHVDHWFGPGERRKIFDREVEIRAVPGHCPGNVLFYFRPNAEADWLKDGAAFVGDALFKGSVGRSDLPGGDFALLERSIRSQIYSLPDGTAIFAGHGPKTTVAAEKASNPYVHD